MKFHGSLREIEEVTARNKKATAVAADDVQQLQDKNSLAF